MTRTMQGVSRSNNAFHNTRLEDSFSSAIDPLRRRRTRPNMMMHWISASQRALAVEDFRDLWRTQAVRFWQIRA